MELGGGRLISPIERQAIMGIKVSFQGLHLIVSTKSFQENVTVNIN
jgi:hypothetical protein